MRFEAMHKIFKSYASVVSFKNLCPSLTAKYLKHICEVDEIVDDNEEINSLISSAVIQGPGRPLSDTLLNEYKELLNFPCDVEYIYSLNWVNIYGTKYVAEKCIIACDADPYTHLPIFGKVMKVLQCGELVVFIVNSYDTERFEESYNGYSVVDTGTKAVCFSVQLLDFNIYQIVETIDLRRIIPLKYDLSDIIEQHLDGCNPLHETVQQSIQRTV